MKRKKRKISLKGKKIITIASGVLVLVGLFFVLYSTGLIKFTKEDKKDKPEASEKEEIVEEAKLNIINQDSDQRPFAVMIDNVSAARPQSGIQSAYMVYEIPVEASLTRLLALFKDSNLEKIGPVRSSRHYFLDYAMENDAIYVHHGWSPQAQSDISSLKINNLNGLANPSSMFWRDKSRKAPHNSYTSSEKMLKAAEKKKYETTSEDYLVLNYTTDEVKLNDKYEDAVVTNSIKVYYSNSSYSGYSYDSENKVYLKTNNTSKHIDALTNEQVKVKNILVLEDISVKQISGDDKGRINLGNIGSGEGYYFTNGYGIKITWEKSSRSAKTVYKDTFGKIIEVSDGNAWIHIQPSGRNLVIE